MIIPKGWSLHYNVDYMKQIIVIGLILLLNACSSVNTRPDSLSVPNTLPDKWSASGRMSVNSPDIRQNAGFDFEFSQDYYQIKLTGTLGLGQVNIKHTPSKLFVNKQPIEMTLGQWMNKHLGWNFPVKKLSNVIFVNDLNIDPNWQINIVSHQLIDNKKYPRIVKLSNPHQDLKIKLVLSDINS